MALIATSRTSTWLSLLLWLAFWSTKLDAAAVNYTNSVDLRSLLTNPSNGWSSNTSIYFPGSTQFTEATERWTVFAPPVYTAAVRPGTEADISKVIKLATAYGVPFLTRGAGHGYAVSLAKFEGIALDLSQFKTINIDSTAETVTIGPGVITGELLDPLFEAGFEIQTGTCQCPALVGVTLGGGVGRFQGVHGLVLDALESVRLVTAKGQTITASETTNSDLFWGIRGAGANFGVITSATYKLHPLINQGNFTYAVFLWPATNASDYFTVLESFSESMNENLSVFTYIAYNETTSQPEVISNWVYLGPEDEAREIMAPVLNLNAPFSIVTTVPYNELISTQVGGNFDILDCATDLTLDLFNLNQYTYSAAAYESAVSTMLEFYDENPNGRGSTVVFENFPNQAMLAVPSNSTAYPYRNARGYVIPSFLWTPGDDATAAAANTTGYKLRTELAAGLGNPNREVFLNYARGDESLEQIYGADKLPHLANLKKTWDPSNVFAYNHPLPTHYP